MTPRRVVLALHALLVLAGLAYLLLAVALHDTPDANIGAGLAVLWLIALGSPWAWPLLATDVSNGTLAAWAVIAALANLGLHGLLWRRLSRRAS